MVLPFYIFQICLFYFETVISCLQPHYARRLRLLLFDLAAAYNAAARPLLRYFVGMVYGCGISRIALR